MITLIKYFDYVNHNLANFKKQLMDILFHCYIYLVASAPVAVWKQLINITVALPSV
ncbi:hypothetical protein Hanom_Chr15g01405911 [Helianthus anomalus]